MGDGALKAHRLQGFGRVRVHHQHMAPNVLAALNPQIAGLVARCCLAVLSPAEIERLHALLDNLSRNVEVWRLTT